MTITEGVSKLTTIDESALRRLIELGKVVIIDELIEQLSNGEEHGNVAKIDIGIGTLMIQFNMDSIKFKFAPNAKFEEDVENACIHKVNLLDAKVESTLKDRILNAYKDLL